MNAWPRKFRTFWCVVDSRGNAYLSTAREKRSRSIEAWVNEVGRARRGFRLWGYWKKAGYSCKRCDIKVRNAGRAA